MRNPRFVALSVAILAAACVVTIFVSRYAELSDWILLKEEEWVHPGSKHRYVYTTLRWGKRRGEKHGKCVIYYPQAYFPDQVQQSVVNVECWFHDGQEVGITTRWELNGRVDTQWRWQAGRIVEKRQSPPWLNDVTDQTSYDDHLDREEGRK